MNIRSNPDTTLPAVTTGPLPSSRKIFATPDAAPDLRVPLREIILSRRRRRAEPAGLRHLRPLHRSDRHHRRQCRPVAQPSRLGQGARRRRGISGPRHQAGRQRQCRRLARRKSLHRASQAAARPRRPQDHAARIRPRRHHHQGDDLRRRARKPRPQAAARARGSSARRRRKLWRRGPRLHHAGIRPQRDRARPRHHPLQHQPRRTRADDHRPQLPDQDQRQYRQLRRDVVGRGGSRQDGVGDPLGRRHRDGPLDRPQHPHHPRMDPAQLADADRHRADLPGAGEVRRRSRSS